MSASVDEIELELPELRVAARAWGPPSGRPVLGLHGWLDNAATFDRLAPRLLERLDLRLVSLDLPGHGWSQHKQGPYHFIDSVADAVAAADALGWDRFTLLGHSMGAGISTLIAGALPERIDRCVLIEGLGPMSEEPELAAKRLARSLRVQVRKRDKSKRVHPDRASAVDRLREAAPMELESAQILVERGVIERDGGVAWRADPRLRLDSRWRMTEAQVMAFLQAISCPVLLIQAEQGWPHSPVVLNARASAIANIERAMLPGRHHLHLDTPEPVAAAIVEFLGRDQ